MQQNTTLTLCWKLIRSDGIIIGFTAHDKELVLPDGIYVPLPGLAASSLAASASLDVDNLDFSAALNHATISRIDVEAGRYDGARLEIFLADWQAPNAPLVHLARLYIADVDFTGDNLKAEARGESALFDRALVETLSPECRASLGDARCKVAVRRFAKLVKIQSLISDTHFGISGPISDIDYYAYGTVRILSGNNAGFESRILASGAQDVTLEDAPPFAMTLGTQVNLIAGCDKRYSTCRAKFENQYNFRGEPFVPGIDSLIRYPGV
jgi:uncharacterized phage protein (TIGR02218 family)